MEMLTEKEKKLVQFSNEIEKDDSARKLVEERVKKELELRRKVHESIVKLTDVVEENELIRTLPYLDAVSWDDMVEERFLARMCGFPSCEREIEHRATQKYHIDLKSRKIYETCKERNKFCCSSCFDVSSSVRCQLAEHPLWLTGETRDRMEKAYVIEARTRPAPPTSKSTTEPPVIDIVEDVRPVMAKLHAFKVVDHSESAEEDNLDDEERAEMRRVKKDDDDFVSSVRRFIEQKPGGTGTIGKGGESARAPNVKVGEPHPSANSLPDRQCGSIGKLNLSSTEEEKLQKLRNKFMRSGAKAGSRSPKLIAAQPVNPKVARETAVAESVQTTEMLDFDGERVSVQQKGVSVESDPVSTTQMIDGKDVEIVRRLFDGWWTERSRHLVLLGGRRPTNDIDELFNRFLKGQDTSETSTVNLPEVDSVDIDKRRLHILIMTIKPAFSSMERRLNVARSRRQLLSQLLSSFKLAPDTVTDFEKSQIQLIVAVLWRIICRMDDELEDLYFPGGFSSDEFDRYLQYAGIEDTVYAQLTKELLSRLD